MKFLQIHLNSSKYDPSILIALAMFCLTLGASLKGIGIGIAIGAIVLSVFLCILLKSVKKLPYNGFLPIYFKVTQT